MRRERLAEAKGLSFSGGLDDGSPVKTSTTQDRAKREYECGGSIGRKGLWGEQLWTQLGAKGYEEPGERRSMGLAC